LRQEGHIRYLGGMLTDKQCYVKYVIRYYQSYDKLKPHDGSKKLCHCLGFVSVLTHEPQLDIDVLKVYNASARLVHHIIIIQKLLVRLISDILIILI
jgi:hypothetical protein